MQEAIDKPLALAPREAPAVDTRDDVRVAASPVRCPFCHDALDPSSVTWSLCQACLARHHELCWRELGRCAACGHARAFDRTRPRATSRLWPVALAALGLAFAAVAFAVGARSFSVRLAPGSDEAKPTTIGIDDRPLFSVQPAAPGAPSARPLVSAVRDRIWFWCRRQPRGVHERAVTVLAVESKVVVAGPHSLTEAEIESLRLTLAVPAMSCAVYAADAGAESVVELPVRGAAAKLCVAREPLVGGSGGDCPYEWERLVDRPGGPRTVPICISTEARERLSAFAERRPEARFALTLDGVVVGLVPAATIRRWPPTTVTGLHHFDEYAGVLFLDGAERPYTVDEARALADALRVPYAGPVTVERLER